MRARCISLGMGHDLFAVAGIWGELCHRARYPSLTSDGGRQHNGRSKSMFACRSLSEASTASASLIYGHRNIAEKLDDAIDECGCFFLFMPSN